MDGKTTVCSQLGLASDSNLLVKDSLAALGSFLIPQLVKQALKEERKVFRSRIHGAIRSSSSISLLLALLPVKTVALLKI